MNIDTDDCDSGDYNAPYIPRCENCGKFISSQRTVPGGVCVGEDSSDDGVTRIVRAEYWQPLLSCRCAACGWTDEGVESGPEIKRSFEPPMVGDWQPDPDTPGASHIVWRETNSKRIEAEVSKSTPDEILF